MRVPGLRDTPTLKLLIVAVPVVAFLIAVGASLAMTSKPADEAAAPAATSVPVSVQVAATPSPPPATATPLPNRKDCNDIRGTSYLSSDERDWFLANCPAPTAVPGRQVQAPSPIHQPEGSQIYGTADRLVIRRLGINAPVNISVVPPSGEMGVPLGANDVVLYDFSAVGGGLGGYPGRGGNTVIAGHVDYICCLAVFAPLRYVQEGDVIDYYTGDGGHYQYVVQWFGDFPNDTNWAPYMGGGPDIMTLITCNGTFNQAAHEYDHRRLVRAVLVQPGSDSVE